MYIIYTKQHFPPLKPLSFVKVTIPHMDSTSACYKTVRRRSNEVGSHRSLISGGSVAEQLGDELKVLPHKRM